MLIKLILFFIWIAVWTGFTGFHTEPQLIIFMFVAPLLTFIFALKFKLLPTKNSFKIGSIVYFIWLLKEILMSAIAVIKIACRKNLRIQPVLEPIKSVQKKNMGIVMYANSITLTPGTVTLSVEGKTLLVHALDLKFIHDLQEGEMDNRIKKVIK